MISAGMIQDGKLIKFRWFCEKCGSVVGFKEAPVLERRRPLCDKHRDRRERPRKPLLMA